MNYETITYNSHKIYKVKVDLDIESILKEIYINDQYAPINDFSSTSLAMMQAETM